MRVFILAALIFCCCGLVAARDLDGHYATQNPDLHIWFDKLASGKGLCCSFIDGVKVENVDWDTASVADASGQSHVVYRVRLGGQWITVPPDAVVTVPNKFGPAVVWPYQDADGTTQIRCFLPGAGA